MHDALGGIDPARITVPIAKDVEETLIVIVSESNEVLYFEPVVEYGDFIIKKQ